MCFTFLQRASRSSACLNYLLYAHCFFDRASSKANSPSSLRFVHQQPIVHPKSSHHSGNLDHFRCGELIPRLLVAFGLWVFVLCHSLVLHWFLCHALLCRAIVETQSQCAISRTWTKCPDCMFDGRPRMMCPDSVSGRNPIESWDVKHEKRPPREETP